jgi:hypothetical protein
MGRLLTLLGQVFENYGSSQRFWATFALIYKLCINYDQNIVWATVLAIFSQTPLDTLWANIVTSWFYENRLNF